MAKTIDLKNRLKYQKEIKETLEYLENVQSELITKMINLAILDKWKEWDEKKEDGSVFEFTEEMLKDTGDSNIDRIYELLERISTIRKEITKG